MNKKITTLILAIFLMSCAGTQRSCSSSCAGELGANWLIVQFKMDGTPFNCWKLNDVSVANEPASDGIYWQDSDGHLVHISGWYNRVQVRGNNFESAAKTVGIELNRCTNGIY